MGGENRTALAQLEDAGGSSPRGRGKLPFFTFFTLLPRLIPAWAGKTLALMAFNSQVEAHPRVGGENETPDEMADVMPGSSPRGRGKPCR